MKVIALLFLLIPLLNFAQEEMIFDSVVRTDSVSAKELYARAKEFIIDTWKSPKDAIVLDDPESGLLIVNSNFNFNPRSFISSAQTKGVIRYQLKLAFKDGRYRYEIRNFVHDAYGNAYGEISVGLLTTQEDCPTRPSGSAIFNDNLWVDCKEKAKVEADMLAALLNKEMQKPSTGSSKDSDW